MLHCRLDLIMLTFPTLDYDDQRTVVSMIAQRLLGPCMQDNISADQKLLQSASIAFLLSLLVYRVQQANRQPEAWLVKRVDALLKVHPRSSCTALRIQILRNEQRAVNLLSPKHSRHAPFDFPSGNLCSECSSRAACSADGMLSERTQCVL